MPDNCDECEHFDHGYGGMACYLAGKEWDYKDKTPDWCPLKDERGMNNGLEF